MNVKKDNSSGAIAKCANPEYANAKQLILYTPSGYKSYPVDTIVEQ
jgi:hypothetical protein